MRKFSFLKMMFVLVSLVFGNLSVKAQITEGFESGLPVSYSSNTSYSLASGTWTGQANGVAESNLGVNSGAHSCLLRSQTGSQIISPNIPTGGVSTVTFWASVNTTSGAIQVNYSTNGGVSWTPATGSPFSLTTGTPVQKTATINSSSSNILIQFYRTSGTVYLDDIVINAHTLSCISSTLAFTSGTINKTITDAAFTQTATSLNGTTAVTYASNNTDVANVNQTTGEVSFVSAGVVTITATQSAGTHNAVDYCSATAAYTLNVASILPTITVTEVTVPAMNALVGNTVTETINVSGINLAENLTVSIIDDVDNEFDEPSLTSISKLGDHTAAGTISVTYRPSAAGTHSATLKIESLGATTATRALSGTATWAPLNQPVAIAATAINSSSFTANWESVSGATEYELNVYTKAVISATDLIISEYIEGTSYNKAIEIYNGTGTTVDLSNYSIKKQTNGAGDYGNELVLSGNLANGDVYVIAYASTSNTSNAEILNKTDLQTSSSVLNYNGNDAVALFKGAVQIDEIGIFNQVSPEWGANATFVRKISTNSPTVPYNENDWTTHAIDYFNNLGIHTGTATTPIIGSPFIITEGSCKAIMDLDAGMTYYYTVIAKNANVISQVSNEITGATLGTSFGLLKNQLEVSEKNGNIIFFALDNETVSIYNAIGQKLVQRITVSGLNTIPVSARGVVLVKVGNRFAKVIL